MPRPIWDPARAKLLPTPRRWVRLEMPDRLGMTSATAGRSAGSAIVARTKVVHTRGAPRGTAQLATRVSQAAGGDKVRRRLSTIFHTPMSGIQVPRAVPPDTSPLTIHGSSCQSPRAQRYWRPAATS